MKKRLVLTMLSLLFVCILSPFAQANALVLNGEQVDWANKMTKGKDIAYWIAPGCQYTVSIPNATKKLMYPDSGTNPLILSDTTDHNHSKLDFYQYSDPDTNTVAYTTSHRKNSSGQYYAMPVYEKNMNDWVYAEVHINDAIMDGMTNAKREVILIHEMLHGYGLKDLYDSRNISSIMYGYSYGTATGVTAEANTILTEKYTNE